MDKSEVLTYNSSRLPTSNKFDVTLPANGTETSGNVQNFTIICQPDYVPSVEEYFTAFNTLGVILFTFGGLAVIITILLFADTIRHIIKNAPPAVKTHSAFVLSVYPVVSISTYCAVIVPRAQLLAEAVTQGMFMACMYQLFCLLMAYCGGEAEMIMSVKPKTLSMRVPPCCCYPCCILPQSTVTKKHVMFLRISVLQLPVIQGLLYMVLLVMWANEERLSNVNYMYLQPIVISSILFGIWAMSMTIKMLSEVLKDYHLQGKFIVLQLVLLFAKFQGLIARIIAWTGGVTCRHPITPSVYTNLVYNSVMLSEMVILGFLARLLYKRDLPGISKVPSTQNQISIIEELASKKRVHSMHKEAVSVIPTFKMNLSVKK